MTSARPSIWLLRGSKDLVVRAGDLTDVQHDEAIRVIAAGEAEWIGVTRRNTSYFVLRWKEKK